MPRCECTRVRRGACISSWISSGVCARRHDPCGRSASGAAGQPVHWVVRREEGDAHWRRAQARQPVAGGAARFLPAARAPHVSGRGGREDAGGWTRLGGAVEGVRSRVPAWVRPLTSPHPACAGGGSQRVARPRLGVVRKARVSRRASARLPGGRVRPTGPRTAIAGTPGGAAARFRAVAGRPDEALLPQ